MKEKRDNFYRDNVLTYANIYVNVYSFSKGNILLAPEFESRKHF